MKYNLMSYNVDIRNDVRQSGKKKDNMRVDQVRGSYDFSKGEP